MSSFRIDLADAIKARVVADTSGYIQTDLVVERAWVPYRLRADIEGDPAQLWVIPMNHDAFPSQSRRSLTRVEVPIQTGLQKTITDHQVTTEIDELVELDEQILNSIRLLNPSLYSWVRTESLKDENALPMDFTKIRDENTFESYHIHYFNFVLQPGA